MDTSIVSRYFSTCKIGVSGYETTGHVFGESSVDPNYRPSNIGNSEYESKLAELANKNIPPLVYDILSRIGDNSRELSGVGGYSIFSLDETLRRNKINETSI